MKIKKVESFLTYLKEDQFNIEDMILLVLKINTVEKLRILKKL